MPASAGASGDSLLDRIVRAKRAEIPEIKLSGHYPGKPASLYQALRRPSGQKVRVIAECKKASPSMGLMRENYDPAEIARTYANLGASAISVLTDRNFFQGQIDHIALARAAGIPILRKDFIISREQIFEAREKGADAILLIVRLLSDDQILSFLELASSLGMDSLLEVHNREEAIRASESGGQIIGINHRDLDTLVMNMNLTPQIAPLLREKNPDAVIVAESGVESREGRSLVDAYVDAVLIGTAFMKSLDIPSTWKELFS